MQGPEQVVERLCARLLDADPAALARAITLVSDGHELGHAIHRAVRPRVGNAQVVGITGPPGAGKSTLIDALVAAWRSDSRRVAVLAIDPSSPTSGGALLGDRTRMGRHTEDPGVYVRSISAGGHLGGLSAHTFRIVDLIDAAGWNPIVLETVGAGQSETEVAEVADTCVVVNAPGLGDEVQALKAGILEIADVLVVNKADSPLARNTERQLESMLELRSPETRKVPVISTIATDGSGVDELIHAIEERSSRSDPKDRGERLSRRYRSLVAQEAASQVKRWLLTDDSPETVSVLTSVAEGRCDVPWAITRLLGGRFATSRPDSRQRESREQ